MHTAIDHAAIRRTQNRNKRDALLREARREFAELGFKGAYIESIAARVGVRKSTFFHYFKDKDALYEQAVIDVLSTIADRVHTVPASEQADEELCRFADALFDALAVDAVAPRLVLRALVDNRADCESALRASPAERIAQRAVALVQRASGARCDPREAAMCIIALVCLHRYTTCPVPTLRLDDAREQTRDALHGRLRAVLRSASA